MLNEDFLINTDIRSVLCSTNWAQLVGGVPFAHRDDFGDELAHSYATRPRPQSLASVSALLDEMGRRAPVTHFLDVSHIAGWSYNPEDQITLCGGSQAVRHIAVQSRTREIRSWDQPIFEDAEEQAIDLICGRCDAGLVLAFRAKWEPGLARRAELAPTRAGPATDVAAAGQIRLRVRQSDEGGRFYRSVATYRIIDIGDAVHEEDYLWLTLSEVQVLLALGIFNNEARSALSLLLRYL